MDVNLILENLIKIIELRKERMIFLDHNYQDGFEDATELVKKYAKIIKLHCTK